MSTVLIGDNKPRRSLGEERPKQREQRGRSVLSWSKKPGGLSGVAEVQRQKGRVGGPEAEGSGLIS